MHHGTMRQAKLARSSLSNHGKLSLSSTPSNNVTDNTAVHSGLDPESRKRNWMQALAVMTQWKAGTSFC
jgi:hypothetical protein